MVEDMVGAKRGGKEDLQLVGMGYKNFFSWGFFVHG